MKAQHSTALAAASAPRESSPSSATTKATAALGSSLPYSIQSGCKRASIRLLGSSSGITPSSFSLLLLQRPLLQKYYIIVECKLQKWKMYLEEPKERRENSNCCYCNLPNYVAFSRYYSSSPLLASPFYYSNCYFCISLTNFCIAFPSLTKFSPSFPTASYFYISKGIKVLKVYINNVIDL